MTDTTTKFFEELEARGHDPRLEKVTATFRFDLQNGDKKNRWLVTVDKGDIAVSHRNAKADCVLRADKATFEGIAAGKVNAFAAVLRGTLRVEGDAELLALFQRVLPAPARKRS
jgi:putative sterol carrier protein